MSGPQRFQTQAIELQIPGAGDSPRQVNPNSDGRRVPLSGAANVAPKRRHWVSQAAFETISTVAARSNPASSGSSSPGR